MDNFFDSFSQFWNPLLTLCLLIPLITWISHPAMIARSNWPLYRTLLWPGIAVHELSHALVAKLLGAEIHEIKLFHKDGGYVTHGPTKLSYLGNFLVGIAPIFGGLAFYFLIIYFFFDEKILNSLNLLAGNPLILDNWFAFAKDIPWSHWYTYLFIFFFLNAGVAIAPSWQDLKNGKPIYIILLLIGLAIGLAGINQNTVLFSQIERINGILIITTVILLIFALFWIGLNLLKKTLRK